MFVVLCLWSSVFVVLCVCGPLCLWLLFDPVVKMSILVFPSLQHTYDVVVVFM